jgi:hypothetical protein
VDAALEQAPTERRRIVAVCPRPTRARLQQHPHRTDLTD